jgi:hypothetical protein
MQEGVGRITGTGTLGSILSSDALEQQESR